MSSARMDHGLNGPPLVERDKEQGKGSQAPKQNKLQVVMVFHKHALLKLMLKREQRCVLANTLNAHMDHGLIGQQPVERDREVGKCSQAQKQNKPRTVMGFHKHVQQNLTLKREPKCLKISYNIGSCKYVECPYGPWSDWTTTCGDGQRARKRNPTPQKKEAESCDGLPQTCSTKLEVEKRTKKCQCDFVECKYTEWSEWTPKCGKNMARKRTLQTIKKTIEKESCDGLPQTCIGDAEQTEKKDELCECDTVKCVQQWSAWSASCGLATRTLRFVKVPIKVKKESCEGLKTTCPNVTETQTDDLFCEKTQPPVTTAPPSDAICGAGYKPIGCFKSNKETQNAFSEILFVERHVKSKTFSFHDYLSSFVCRCATKARFRKFNFFAVSSEGQCLGGKDDDDSWSKHSAVVAKECNNSYHQQCSEATPICFGAEQTLFAYKTELFVQHFLALVVTYVKAYSQICRIDLGIILDDSGSIKHWGFEQEKKFIRDVTRHLHVSSSNTRVSVMTFSTHPRMRIFFRDGSAQNWNSLNWALNGIRHSDGQSQSGHSKLSYVATLLKNNFVNIISIGVGYSVRRSELELIASRPIHQHVFQVRDAGALNRIINTALPKRFPIVGQCDYVECKYTEWSNWTPKCGKNMARKRTLQTIKKTIEKKSCDGLPQTCTGDAEQTEKKDELCECDTFKCIQQWSAWSASCGLVTRTLRFIKVPINVKNESCARLVITCPNVTETQTDDLFSSDVICGAGYKPMGCFKNNKETRNAFSEILFVEKHALKQPSLDSENSTSLRCHQKVDVWREKMTMTVGVNTVLLLRRSAKIRIINSAVRRNQSALELSKPSLRIK
eukprot:gene13502-4382_t